jgi:hypothetical protein
MIDTAAREGFRADPDIQGLASARLAVEHMTHHGRPLQFAGSSYHGDVAEHRFRCHDCPLQVTISVVGG